LVGHYRFYVDPHDPLVQFAEGGGGALACQAVREVVVYTPRPGYVVHQDDAQSNWGNLLAPGNYRSLTSRSTWQTCFGLPASASAQVGLLNQDVGGSVPTAR